MPTDFPPEWHDSTDDAIQAFALGVPLWAYLDAAASVRLDREGDGQTYAIEPEEVPDGD